MNQLFLSDLNHEIKKLNKKKRKLKKKEKKLAEKERLINRMMWILKTQIDVYEWLTKSSLRSRIERTPKNFNFNIDSVTFNRTEVGNDAIISHE